MARISYKPKLPAPVQRIVRVACSFCRRSWAVYEGTLPRMWTAQAQSIVCDLPGCRAAASAPPPSGRRASLRTD